jgi:3'-5' exoribonuclease
MTTKLTQLKNQAIYYGVETLCKRVLDSSEFSWWSGAGKDIHHHYGDGGLIRHTYEVVQYVITASSTHRQMGGSVINSEELFVSAIWHDYGKLWDYQKVAGVWGKHDTHARQIHHISRSALEFAKWYDQLVSEGVDVSNVNKDNVIHNILSHHGCREWGSPVSPVTKEAWILHLADNMSARLDDCNKHDRF